MAGRSRRASRLGLPGITKGLAGFTQPVPADPAPPGRRSGPGDWLSPPGSRPIRGQRNGRLGPIRPTTAPTGNNLVPAAAGGPSGDHRFGPAPIAVTWEVARAPGAASTISRRPRSVRRRHQPCPGSPACPCEKRSTKWNTSMNNSKTDRTCGQGSFYGEPFSSLNSATPEDVGRAPGGRRPQGVEERAREGVPLPERSGRLSAYPTGDVSETRQPRPH